MKRLIEAPTIHATASMIDCTLGIWTEVEAYGSLREVAFGDYSQIVRDSDSIWSTSGKFCSIACGDRSNPGNHATWRASQHHFTYRAAQYGLRDDDDAFLAQTVVRGATTGSPSAPTSEPATDPRSCPASGSATARFSARAASSRRTWRSTMSSAACPRAC